jgi:hypothetical protein
MPAEHRGGFLRSTARTYLTLVALCRMLGSLQLFERRRLRQLIPDPQTPSCGAFSIPLPTMLSGDNARNLKLLGPPRCGL